MECRMLLGIVLCVMIILAPVALAAKPTKMIDPGKKRLSENNPADHHL